MNAKLRATVAIGLGSALLVTIGVAALSVQAQPKAPAAAAACAGGDTGITLPPGFCATVFADNVGNVRHIAVSADGTLYGNLWNGSSYFPRDKPPTDAPTRSPTSARPRPKAPRAAPASGSTRASSMPR